ncbi:MAG TPA: cytochrome C [Bacteroidetes bacterium]|nr:cytochrome C [Bacteroidota bacterium]
MKNRNKNIWLFLILVFVVIQLFPIDQTNPPADPEDDFITIEKPPEAIGALVKTACYDCHSYQTKYPWYVNIQPVGWWMRSHFRGARKELNFSQWSQYDQEDKAHHFSEMAEEVEEKHMPLKSYTWMHPEARLSNDDRQMLVDFFQSRE